MYKQGFTLIELLFVLAITLIISSFSFIYRKPTISIEYELSSIKAMFYKARGYAMMHKTTTKVTVSEKSIHLTGMNLNDQLKLANRYYFKINHTFTYNEKGHIKIAKTLPLQTPNKLYKFVFQLGSGTFYVS